MSWLKKKHDPISERSRSLSSEISALEAQIKRLDAQLQRSANHPHVRSTALPQGKSVPHSVSGTAPVPTPAPAPVREPIFEDLDQRQLKTKLPELVATEHYNELGGRKLDATALTTRVKQLFRGSAPMNPRLINYLAAGGVQGLQPLRRERRVARNRFILFTVFLVTILFGIIYTFTHNR